MSSVQVYLYDISGGMARALAPALLGRPLEGVWHTGVVAYGREFFFGGGGIAYCPPGGTIAGNPTEIADLGRTEIPEEIFMEYLSQIAQDKFRGDRYHLLHHNCNTFSDEIATFLTGKGVPEKVASLTADVLSTPMGRSLEPMINSMMMRLESSNATHISSGTPQPPQNSSPQGPPSNSEDNSNKNTNAVKDPPPSSKKDSAGSSSTRNLQDHDLD